MGQNVFSTLRIAIVVALGGFIFGFDFVNSLVSFGVQLVFPWEISTVGASWTFNLYALFACISLALVIWLVPETRGKTLEELEKELAT